MRLVGRHSLVERIVNELEAGRSVIAVGAPGDGKTAVLEAVAQRLEDARIQPMRVEGSDGEAGVPLAPFAGILAKVGLAAVSTLEIYTRLPRELVASGARVIVDDLHLLDASSRVLVESVTREGVPVLASAASTAELPRGLRDGLEAGRWVRFDIEALDPDAVVDLAASLLGGEPSVLASARLIERAQGSPQAVIELVEAGVGATTAGAGGIDMPERFATARSLSTWSEHFARLEHDAITAIERLAVARELPAESVDPSVLTLLRKQGLVTVTADVRLDSASLADAVVLSMGPAVAAARAREASDLAAQAGASSAHCARLDVLGGRTVSADAGLDAARDLLAHDRASDALDVLDATDVTPGPEVDVLRAAILSSLERLDEAATLLAETQPHDEATAFERAQQLGVLHAVRRSDPAAAVSAVERSLDTLQDESHRTVIHGELVKWRLMAGMPGVSPAELTQEAGADLRVSMSLIQAMVASLDGPSHYALETVASGRRDLGAAVRPARHAEELLALSEFLAVCFDARVAEAEALAAERRRNALIKGDSAVGLWEFASAELAFHTGRYEAAEVFARRASAHLAWRDFTGLRPTALALLAAVAARNGHHHIAQRTLAGLTKDAGSDVKVALHQARALAQGRLRMRDGADAVRLLNAAGSRALEESHRHLGIFALDEAWAIAPHARQAAILAEHRDASALATLLIERVDAFHNGDIDRLVRAADALGEAGLLGRAAHGLELAAVLCDQRALHADARRLRARSRAAQSFEQSSAWPLTFDEETLTAREREIASLAAARVRSREIAARLGVSVRTVDNHLGRVFRKLGVQSRDELGEALAQADSAGVAP